MSFGAAKEEVFVGNSVDDGGVHPTKQDPARFQLFLLTAEIPSIEVFASGGVVAGAA